jgi:hypothetical protein
MTRRQWENLCTAADQRLLGDDRTVATFRWTASDGRRRRESVLLTASRYHSLASVRRLHEPRKSVVAVGADDVPVQDVTLEQSFVTTVLRRGIDHLDVRDCPIACAIEDLGNVTPATTNSDNYDEDDEATGSNSSPRDWTPS